MLFDMQGTELRRPEASVRRQRLRLADTLRALGAGRLSDTFILPLAGDSTPHFARKAPVQWRHNAEDFWVRTADVPFDLLPFRPRSTARVGAFFTIGPALTADGRLHPLVLLVQIEGPPDTVARHLSTLAPRIRELAPGCRQSHERHADDWERCCLTGVVPLDESDL